MTAPVTTWTRSLNRKRKALYISSPIGLGHAQRDVAIADELRKLHPDLADRLARPAPGHGGPRVTRRDGSTRSARSSPTSPRTSPRESSEHDLNAFQAIRRMDEILVANFMVFHDAIESGEYDLVIGDEAWDVDYFLHENPELKRTAFAWMTDFVGWLPMPSGGDREAFLTSDYNAEMIEQVERFPRIRDRAIFVGEPDDIVPDDFGPGLRPIRDWTERHFEFSGYVTGFDPTPLIEGREELRRELGYQPDERVVIVTVGGSGVGESLLRRVIASYPDAARRVNGLRMIAVAGPRIDPASLGAVAGVEVRAFVPDLYRHLAACDLAVVQGGLTTTMELAAARRPFLYFPLRDHFEQNRHVRHRLDALRRRALHGVRGVAAGGHRRGHRRGDRPAGRLPPGRNGRGGTGGGTDRAAHLALGGGRLPDLVEEGEGAGLPLQGLADEVAQRRLDLALDRGGQAELGQGLDVEALVGLEQLQSLQGEAGAVVRRPGTALADDAAEWRDPAETLLRLEHAVALDAAIDLGAHAELVEQVHLVPARDPTGRHARIEQLVGAAQERVQRFGGVALLETAVRELGEIPGGGGTLQGVAQVQPGVPDADLGDDLERAAASERHGQLRERLQAATEPRGRPPDALGDRLELAAAGGDERQDPVRLPQVEA